MSEFGNWIRQRIKSKCIGRPCSHKFVPRGGLSMEASFQHQERSSGLLSRISPVPFPFCDIDLLDSMLLCRFTPFPCKDGDLPQRKEVLLKKENCGILTQELEVLAGLQGFGDQTA